VGDTAPTARSSPSWKPSSRNDFGRLAQRKSAALTLQKSLVRSQYRPPYSPNKSSPEGFSLSFCENIVCVCMCVCGVCVSSACPRVCLGDVGDVGDMGDVGDVGDEYVGLAWLWFSDSRWLSREVWL
jgi:hypothetical protein